MRNRKQSLLETDKKVRKTKWDTRFINRHTKVCIKQIGELSVEINFSFIRKQDLHVISEELLQMGYAEEIRRSGSHIVLLNPDDRLLVFQDISSLLADMLQELGYDVEYEI